MALDVTGRDPYADHLDTTVVDAGPARAVVEQPASPSLGNHVGVRHASALYTAGHAAARALVLAALGDRAGSAGLHLVESEIPYVHVGFGLIPTTAEPPRGGWYSLGAALASPRPPGLAAPAAVVRATAGRTPRTCAPRAGGRSPRAARRSPRVAPPRRASTASGSRPCRRRPP